MAIRERVPPHLEELLLAISLDTDPQAVWFNEPYAPSPLPQPVATRAFVTAWDGRTAVVEHDGSCDLIINRTYYPGWMASVNGAPERPVASAEAGIQGIRLVGRGPSRVTFTYRPESLPAATLISLAALAAAGLGLALEVFGLVTSKRQRSAPRCEPA